MMNDNEKFAAPRLGASESSDAQNSAEESRTGKNWIEWSVFGVSLLLVLGVIAMLSFQAVTRRDAPPFLKTLVVDEQRASGQATAFKVLVENAGNTTVHSVDVEVAWPRARQSAAFSLDHVPRDGKRFGWALFEPQNGVAPRREELIPRVVGYQE